MSSTSTIDGVAAAKRAPVIDDADVRELLAQHDFLEVIETGEGEHTRVRVRCELTQHELLPRKDAIEAHLRSKKFIKAKEWYCYDYSKYAPLIVPHRRKPKCLYCNVTHTVLNRIPAEVERHVNGKKFQRLKERVKAAAERKSKSKRTGEPDGEQKDGDDEEDDEEDADFDANAFEFENAQVLLSDNEDEDASSAKPSKKQASQGDDDDGEEDDDSEDEDEDDGDEDDSDMAEFYPNDDDDDDEGRLDHETIVKLAAQPSSKKRKVSDADAKQENGDDIKDEDAASPTQTAKKQKPALNKPQQQPRAPKQASKARMSAKDRRQLKKTSFKK